MDPFVTPIDMDEIILTGTGASAKKQSIDTGYNYILLENNSEHDIDVSFTDPRTHPELSTITVNPMECLPLPKLNNRKFVIFIEGTADDTVHLYYCDSKFPEMFVEMLAKIIVKQNLFMWRSDIEVNNVANHFLDTIWKIVIDCMGVLGRYGQHISLLDTIHPLKIYIYLRNDGGYKADNTDITYTVDIPANVAFSFPPPGINVQILHIKIEHLNAGVNAFNPSLVVI